MDTYRPAIGTPLAELDTPCLLADLDALEHNMQMIANTYRDTTCKMRGHVKNLKTPVLAHMQRARSFRSPYPQHSRRRSRRCGCPGRRRGRLPR